MQWGQQLLSEVVQAGDLVVDLTVGTGKDTLFLYDLVGSGGQIVGVDVQSQALVAAQKRLAAAGGKVRMQLTEVEPPVIGAGIDLLQISHAEISAYVPAPAQAIIANLGYLPGGDKALVTQPETTLHALIQACSLLAVGGRLVVVVYPGHPGGEEEGRVVSDYFTQLCDVAFQVIHLQVCNRPQAPFLFVAEKLKGANK